MRDIKFNKPSTEHSRLINLTYQHRNETFNRHPPRNNRLILFSAWYINSTVIAKFQWDCFIKLPILLNNSWEVILPW